MANIVVLYFSATDKPLRGTVREHLYAFERSGHNCYYLNLGARRIPRHLLSQKIDLVVFHTILLSYRWGGGMGPLLRRHGNALRRLGGVRIAMPQDEFLHTDALSAFINEYDVRHVFSVAPESEWPKIYAGVDFDKVQFHKVLTGYLDDRTVAHINALARTVPERTIDIAYRAWEARPWLGRHGMLKKQIAEAIGAAATAAGLRCDMSLREQDTLYGDDWLRFLLRSKYTVGVEGGASMLDRDGSLRERVDRYTEQHPGASFDEVERACFPGRDGELHLFALSPRHLEACATRTCQVLVEGHYDGVLVPNRHYIPLAADFSNLPQVIERLKDDGARQRMVATAYDEIVASGRYDNRTMVDFVVERSLGGASASAAPTGFLWRLGPYADRLSYTKAALAAKARRATTAVLPSSAMSALRAVKRRLMVH